MFKSKAEMAIALASGMILITQRGNKLFFDDTMAQPFRTLIAGDIDTVGMHDGWHQFKTVKEEKSWYDEIPSKGRLCYVWNDNELDKDVYVVTEYIDDAINPFKTSLDSWNNATPLTRTEILNMFINQ